MGRAYNYPVRREETSWDRALWPQATTWAPVLNLIEREAESRGRRAQIDVLDERAENPHVVFTIDAEGRIKYELSLRDRRAVTLCHTIHAAIRTYVRQTGALIIRQVDGSDGAGRTRREIVIRRGLQTRGTATQLKRLHKALQSAVSPSVTFQIEAAYSGLTDLAWNYMGVGWRIAGRRGDLTGFCGEFEVPAMLISRPMLAPDLLKVITPYAVRAASRPGRRPVHPRDEALSRVLDVFVEVGGHPDPAAWRDRDDEPLGPGADFVRQIEEIFGLELMPAGSTHAVKRASKLMRGPHA